MEKYSKKVLKKVSKQNNGIIVIPKCKSIEEKKWVSTYISVHFSFDNKKVLLIVTDTENTNNKEQYNINMLWNAIKKTDTKNLDVLIITPSQFENNKFETIINLIKEKYRKLKIAYDISDFESIHKLWILNYYMFNNLARNPAKRGMILARNPLKAVHRYPVSYAGTSKVSWENFKSTPFFNLSASNIGACWWSHDVGGYMVLKILNYILDQFN